MGTLQNVSDIGRIVTAQEVQRIRTKQSREDRDRLIVGMAMEQMRQSSFGMADVNIIARELNLTKNVVSSSISRHNRMVAEVEEEAKLKIAEQKNILRLQEGV